MRQIDDVLHFRHDISPFLVHLTKDNQAGDVVEQLPKAANAHDCLWSIIEGGTLKQSRSFSSTVACRNGGQYPELVGEVFADYFGAICFTETPLDQVQCLLDIQNRQTNLEAYGIVFVKEKLASKHVAPVLYLNNELGDQQGVLDALYGMCSSPSPAVKSAAKCLVPLVSMFGAKVPQGGNPPRIDFRWEREWRLAHVNGDLPIDPADVFLGLCPETETAAFEGLFNRVFPPTPALGRLHFIDPQRPMQWYATELIDARQRLNLPYSVV